jgi:hypothetical protein
MDTGIPRIETNFSVDLLAHQRVMEPRAHGTIL